MDSGAEGIIWALELKDITKVFGTFPALSNINFKLERKKFLTIFGPNGAGKTTMIKILSTLMKPTSGEAWILGMSIRKDKEQIRRAVGMLSHNTYLYPNLTAFENLQFYASLYKLEGAKERVDDLL
ncbi:MAG: ATP-binding cassette domain-containing protein, partial [Candidatus Aenigmatarchaeota archaeon]